MQPEPFSDERESDVGLDTSPDGTGRLGKIFKDKPPLMRKAPQPLPPSTAPQISTDEQSKPQTQSMFSWNLNNAMSKTQNGFNPIPVSTPHLQGPFSHHQEMSPATAPLR